MTLPAGYSKVRLTDVEAILNVQNEIVGFIDADGTESAIAAFSKNAGGAINGLMGPSGTDAGFVRAETNAETGVVELSAGGVAIQTGGASTAEISAAVALAEAARDAAFVNANVYADTTAGLAAVALSEQFQVVSGSEIIRYREDAGPVATEVARYPAAGSTARMTLPSNVVSYYPCDEGAGTSLRDIVGGKTASTTSGGGTVGWTREGWLQLTAGWFKTASQLTQTVVVLFRCPEGYTNYNFAAPNNDAVGNAYYASSASTIKALHGWGISDVPRRSSAAGPPDLFAGGWCMVSLQIASATTNVTAIGSGSITGSGPVSSMEVAGIAILSGTATDAQLRQILNFAAEKNRNRGIFLTPWHCPRPAHLALIVGESTSEGTALLSGLSAGQLAAANESVLINARNMASNTATGMVMKRLSLAATYANNNPASTATKSGLEVGLLNARINRTNDGRPLHILKVAQGSTYIVPSGSYANAAGGTTTVISAGTRNTGELETGGMTYMLELLNARRMENIARNHGAGYTSVSMIYNEGLNDAYIGTVAVPDAVTYQGYLQARYDKLESMLGIANLKMICIKPHEPLGGLGAGDPDYPNTAVGTNRLTALGYIRTALDSFQAANSADVSLLDGNSYALNTPTDYIHPSAAGYDAMGGAAEALFAYSVAVTPKA